MAGRKKSSFHVRYPKSESDYVAFMNRNNPLYPFTCPGAASDQVIIACFEEFIKPLAKKTVVVLDHASTHHSKLLNARSGIKKAFTYNLFHLIIPNRI
jgi:hypothetical protein